MEQKKLTEMTDQELLKEVKSVKSATILNAILIGFLVGVVAYSFAKNTWGFLTLIPIYLAYKLINKPKPDGEELERLLKERNLK